MPGTGGVKLAPALLTLTLLLAITPRGAAAQADHSWTTAHVVLASAASLSILIDWSQTRQAMGQGWAEKNPILGTHPSSSRLAFYNMLAIGGTVGIGALLPQRWRTVWFGSVIGLEAYTIAGNASLGLHIGF